METQWSSSSTLPHLRPNFHSPAPISNRSTRPEPKPKCKLRRPSLIKKDHHIHPRPRQWSLKLQFKEQLPNTTSSFFCRRCSPSSSYGHWSTENERSSNSPNTYCFSFYVARTGTINSLIRLPHLNISPKYYPTRING